MEDEPRVRKLLCDTLSQCGYHVLEAGRGDEALRLAELNGRIDLAVLDVVMPELSGPEVARQLALLHPEMRLLFISGYTDEAIVHHGVLNTGAAFLPKPFLPQVLAGKVREILDVRGENAGTAKA